MKKLILITLLLLSLSNKAFTKQYYEYQLYKNLALSGFILYQIGLTTEITGTILSVIGSNTGYGLMAGGLITISVGSIIERVIAPIFSLVSYYNAYEKNYIVKNISYNSFLYYGLSWGSALLGLVTIIPLFFTLDKKKLLPLNICLYILSGIFLTSMITLNEFTVSIPLFNIKL